jgi:TRAP-type mannitol/chloroaromatic compound transport system permease small subunit
MSKNFISAESSLDKKLQLRHTPITKKIDNIVLQIGEIFNWLWVILIAVIILNVVLRYVFKNGMIELEELQWHLYCCGLVTWPVIYIRGRLYMLEWTF